MRATTLLLIFTIIFLSSCVHSKKVKKKQFFKITQEFETPIGISNNAVSQGIVNGKKYSYSFGGIDTSKTYKGILKSVFNYNTNDKIWKQLGDIPDSLGKIASAASSINGIIYIVGGYYVFKNGLEISSNKVHRFQISSNKFLNDGASLPVPIDDQVQAVWRDSLLYVISGWSNTNLTSKYRI